MTQEHKFVLKVIITYLCVFKNKRNDDGDEEIDRKSEVR